MIGAIIVGISDIADATSPVGNILVNGVDVKSSTLMNHNENCYILEHEKGYYFPQSESGQYDIKIRITGVAGVGRAYISSVMVL